MNHCETRPAAAAARRLLTAAALLAASPALVPSVWAQSAEPMAREAYDAFRVHCLANLANPKLVRDGAREMKYAPAPVDLVRRLGIDEAWYVPSDKGSIVLGLNARGHCGIVAQDVDIAGFTKLVEDQLSIRAASDEAAGGWRTLLYSLVFDNRTATLRLRQSAEGHKRGPVSLTVSDARPIGMDLAYDPARTAPPAATPRPASPIGASPPVAAANAAAAGSAPASPAPASPAPASSAPASPAPGPAAKPAPAAGQVAAAPTSPLRTRPPAKPEGPQLAFPAPAAVEAWDPSRPVLENHLTTMFGDACYQTRAQPADVLARAQQQKWRPLQTNLIGGGFDFAWTTDEAPPGQTMVFYDSLKTRCCASMFGIRKLDLLTAATRRFALVPDRAYAAAGKEVLQFKARKDYRIVVDFETATDGKSFANLCYQAR